MSADGNAIVAYMMRMGFAPNRTHNPMFIEFIKDFHDPSTGRLGKAVVQFERPVPGSLFAPAEARLSGFTVLMQAFIAADPAMVESRAPSVMREDLLTIARAFEAGKGVRPAAVAVQTCGSCSASVSEFFIIRKKVYCHSCKDDFIKHTRDALASRPPSRRRVEPDVDLVGASASAGADADAEEG